jgi:class 3 adenylate cyclase/tetratricopeptide (TPR) repeat protein
VTCLRCGASNPEGFRFCGACGADLAGGAGRETRKTVTVLFADVQGSTALGEHLDPESLRHVMGRYFDEMRSVIERHGGTAEKFIGDAVMAVFGIPVVHEDDARRALHAASDMRARLSTVNAELERDFGVRIEVRIGVNTGEVVTGDEGSGQRLATGDAVNVAARLEQAAGPGEILLGEQTYTLARDAIEVTPVDPLTLKGKSEAVAAYRLKRVIAGAPSFERRLDVPLVGRRDELGRVRQAFERTISERRCRLITVIGPPGIGKTRLAREVSATVRDSAVVLAGRCLPYGEGITYWPLREIFAGAGAESELDTALAAGAPEEIFYAVRKAIEGRARERPLMLVVEDIHWAEPTLLELLEHLTDWTRDAQLLLFCLARPELLDARPGWGGRANSETLTLEPLAETDTDELIERLLGGTSLESEARQRVRRVAEGNPLFVEQLLAALAEGGDPDRVPPTIQALLSARLDSLPDDERELVERASVAGLEFEWEALTALARDGRRPAGASLTALVRKDLIRPHEILEDTFWFRHMLIRDAAYARIPKELRSEYHERFADWLDGRGEEFEEIVGYHLEQASLLVAELGPPGERGRALSNRAAEHLVASGRRASARGDLTAAANFLERAVALLPVSDPGRLRLLPFLARTMFEVGRTEVARAVLDEAITTARVAHDQAVAAEASIELLFLRLQAGEIAQEVMRRELDDAVRVFEELGDIPRLSRALGISGTLRFWRGDASATVDLERAARLALQAGDRAQAAIATRYQIVHHVWGPTPFDEVRDFLRQIPATLTGNRMIEIGLIEVSAYLAAAEGRSDEARELIGRVLALGDEFGDRRLMATTRSRIGEAVVLLGDLVEAEKILRESYDLFTELGQWGYAVTPGWRLAQVLCDLGRDDEAERVLDLVDAYTVPEDLDPQIGRRSARAKLLARRGELAEAERLAREAVKLGGRTSFLGAAAEAIAVLGEVLRRAGRDKESADASAEAIGLYRKKGNVAAIARIQQNA